MEVVDFGNLRREQALSEKNTQMRKIEDHYEFCLVKDYDSILEFENAQAVQLGPVFANLVEMKERYIFVSIMFPTGKFDLDGVISWMDHFGIHWDAGKNTGSTVSGAAEILQGLKFKGNPIILYRKGHKKLTYNCDDFVEITEQYAYFSEVGSVLNVKDISKEEPELKLFLNGERISEVPRIDFEQENLIISNGTFICADYMDDYFGCVAFFRVEDPSLPAAWVQDKNTSVYIELQENDEFGQVCILKFAYELDLDEL